MSVARAAGEASWHAQGEPNGLLLLTRRVKASVRRQADRGRSIETIRRTWARIVGEECDRLGVDAGGRTRILDAVYCATQAADDR